MAKSFKPPKSAQREAAKGLDIRRNSVPSKRGGTPVGIARARDLSSGKSLSKRTLERMVSFFARHSVDKKRPGSKAQQTWLLWGGDSGRSWAKRMLRKVSK